MLASFSVLLAGLFTQAVLAAVIAGLIYTFSRTYQLQRTGMLVGSWTALSVFYFATAVPAPSLGEPGDLARILISILATTSLYTFAILLGDGLLAVAQARRLPGRWRAGLLATGAVLAVVGSLLFLAPSDSAVRYFARVGVRALLVGVAVVGYGGFLLHKGPARTLSRRLLGVGLLGWGLVQLHYGATALLGLFGFAEPPYEAYLTHLGILLLALSGLAMAGWLLERERFQAAEEGARFQALFNESAVPMAFIAADLTWMRVNRSLCRLLGRPPEELLGRPTSEVTHPEDVAFTDAAAETIRQSDPSRTHFARRYLRRDGSTVWVNVTISIIRGAGGDPAYFAGVYEDVTERRNAEAALTRAEQRSRVMVEQSSDMVSVLSPDGTVLFVSPAIERLMGYRADQRMGHSVVEVVHQDDRARLLETVARAAAAPQGSVEVVRFRAVGGDGSWRRLESAITNLLEEPAIKGLVANTRDITAREQLEEQFRQAQKMEGVGRLAGGIAHDFNNLLTVILGNASLVERELPAESSLRADVAMIRDAAERGADLTRQLLAFARRQVVEPKVVDLNASLREMRDLIGRVLGPTVELQQDLAGDAGAVRVDPGQLHQVMVNLAINAKDALPDGGRVIIRTRRRRYLLNEAREIGLSGPGDYVQLDMEDSGAGFALEARDRLFEPFFTTKPDGQGTGLGLATCYGIVRQSDGVILAQDSPEGGALLRVILPHAIQPLSDLVSDPGPGRQGWETVLVVDDEPAVRSLVVRTLRRQGYRVLEAEDGVAGEKVSQGHAEPIHALVSDVVMPRMGGLELAERIRRERPDVHLLFTSGFADGFDFRDQAALHGAEFLEKPFRPQALIARLRGLLDRPAVEPRNAAP